MTDLIARLTDLEKAATPEPWRWIRAENGQGWEETTLIGGPDNWKPCEYFCFGWGPDSPRSRGPQRTPGHEHNRFQTILAADGWHGSGDLIIETDGPDAQLIVELRNNLPAILHALKVTKAAEEWEPLYQTVTYGEPKIADHKKFEQAERALVAAVKGEQK